MTRYWPETLPTPIGPGYELTPADPFLRTDMEVGAARNRALTLARRDRVQAVWRMSPVEFVAFRAWFEDLPWSLAGDSDDLSGWTATAMVWSASAGLGPGGQATGRILETADGGEHRWQIAVPALASAATASVSLVLRAAGRSVARVGLIGRDGVARSANVDLAAGVVTWSSGTGPVSVRPAGGGWYRVTLQASVGSGGAAASLRLTMLDDSLATSYAGDPAKGVDVAEVNVRVASGYDLFLPTGADGRATGAGRGGAWALIPVWTGGALAPVECRFEGMFSVEVMSGLNVNVSAPLEVRYA